MLSDGSTGDLASIRLCAALMIRGPRKPMPHHSPTGRAGLGLGRGNARLWYAYPACVFAACSPTSKPPLTLVNSIIPCRICSVVHLCVMFEAANLGTLLPDKKDTTRVTVVATPASDVRGCYPRRFAQGSGTRSGPVTGDCSLLSRSPIPSQMSSEERMPSSMGKLTRPPAPYSPTTMYRTCEDGIMGSIHGLLRPIMGRLDTALAR